jgi:putative pyruvate formate lyase activating enzyme
MINKNIIKLAEKVTTLMSSCSICPRNCRCDRNSGEIGFCGVGQSSTLCKELVHYTEEAELVPTYSIYFSGCNMRCEYCSNAVMLFPDQIGESIDHIALADRADRALKNGSQTIFFLGGEPTCSLRDVILTLANIQSPAPVVWNSNMYIAPEAFEIVLQISDVFLADLKFGCEKCAIELAKTPAYLENVQRNIKRAYDSGKRVIIRHLPLSGHFDCCTKPVLEWIAVNCPDAPVGILPLMPPANTKLKPPHQNECDKIKSKVQRLGLIKIDYVINNTLPSVGATTRTIESALHIRRDGSIAVQDTSSEILNILNKLSGS